MRVVCVELDNKLSNEFRISSIVYAVYFDQEIDIKKANRILKNSKVCDGIRLNFKMVDPKATICMSKSGYIRSMGTDSFDKAKRAIYVTLKEFLEKGVITEINVTKERVENIVALGTVSQRLDLEELAENLDNCIYEPEQFPAIIYRPFGKVVMLLFASGKIVVVGAVTIKEINAIYAILKKKLKDK